MKFVPRAKGLLHRLIKTTKAGKLLDITNVNFMSLQIITNETLICLLDVCESIMLDSQRLYKEDGKEFKHEIKKTFNTALFNLRKYLQIVRERSLEDQCQFGENADELKKLIFLYLDRTDGRPDKTELFMNYLKNVSSELNIDFKKLNL